MIYFNTSQKCSADNHKTSVCPDNSHYLPQVCQGRAQRGVCVCVCVCAHVCVRLADPGGILGAGCKPQKKTNKSPSQEAFLRYSGF